VRKIKLALPEMFSGLKDRSARLGRAEGARISVERSDRASGSTSSRDVNVWIPLVFGSFFRKYGVPDFTRFSFFIEIGADD